MSRSLHVIQGDLTPMPNDVLVSDMEQGDRLTEKGLYLLDDNTFDDKNIKPRWCKVYKVGEKVTDVSPGQWILVEHGRWSYGVTFNTGEQELYLQKVDSNAILMVSDTYLGDRRF